MPDRHASSQGFAVARTPEARLSRPLLLWGVSAVIVASLAGCSDTTGPSAVEEVQDQILFVTTRSGSVDPFGSPLSDIYRMNADGSDVERLTEQSAAYKFLRLSPDGRQVVFYSDLGSCYDIWVMGVDGTGLTQLTGVVSYERCNERPSWSPDGSRIAFDSSRQPELGWDVYVMNADGSGVVNVSDNPSTDYATANDNVGGWSPDGRVVLYSERDGTRRMYLVGADGSGIEPLFGGVEYWSFAWSPTGNRAVATAVTDGNSEVLVMNADGSGIVNVSSDPGADALDAWAPNAWSPDGGKVAFESQRSGNLDVFVVAADGTGLMNVSASPGDDRFLDWSPDGTRLLMASEREGRLEIYVVNADGTGATNLTNAPGSDDGLAAIWVPHR